MSRKFLTLALIMAAAPAAFAQGAGEAAPPRAAPEQQAAPIASPVEVAPTPVGAPDGAPASGTAQPVPAPTGFDSQVAFSPTYSSGYYYASPYSGYTSLAYYGSIYTARKFGG